MDSKPFSNGDVYRSNLALMLQHAFGTKAEQVREMLEQDIPGVNNFVQLRQIGKAFVDNQCKKLRRVPVSSEMELGNLSESLKARFFDGCFFLGEGEGVVFQDKMAYGPFPREVATQMAAKLSVASQTNDKQGHILDPEKTPHAKPAMEV